LKLFAQHPQEGRCGINVELVFLLIDVERSHLHLRPYRVIIHASNTSLPSSQRISASSPQSRRQSRPVPPTFPATASTPRRPGSRGGGRPTTCLESTGCWVTDAATKPARPASAWPPAGARHPTAWMLVTE